MALFLAVVAGGLAGLGGVLIYLLGTLGARQQQLEADVRFLYQCLATLCHQQARDLPRARRHGYERSADGLDA